jgi:GNAT superfamily N-acetyltransferase
MTNIAIEIATAGRLRARIEELAQLRMQVFREFPYLYDGTVDYEMEYLQTYMDSPEAMAVLALDGTTVVGASTAVPMRWETAEFKRPFIERGIDPEQVFYLGESVLLPQYRGGGLYRQFFAAREAHARSLREFEYACFCAVQRPHDHPLRPADYQPLDDIWRHFGYDRRADFVTMYHWKDVDQPTETDKPMVFWLKSLRNQQS